jgi:hypothetical protein
MHAGARGHPSGRGHIQRERAAAPGSGRPGRPKAEGKARGGQVGAGTKE